MSYITQLDIVQASAEAAKLHINTTDPGIPDYYWWDNLGTPTLNATAVSALSALNNIIQFDVPIYDQEEPPNIIGYEDLGSTIDLETYITSKLTAWSVDRLLKQSQRIAAIEIGIGFTEAANVQLMSDIQWLYDGTALANIVTLSTELNTIVANNISVYGGDWDVKANAITTKANEIHAALQATGLEAFADCIFAKDSDVNSYELTFLQKISTVSNYSKTESQLNVDMLTITGNYAAEVAVIQYIRDGLASQSITPEQLMGEIILGCRTLAGIDAAKITAWNTACTRP